VTTLPSRWTNLDEKVPRRLADLRGPATGTISLPRHLVWSGLNDWDLSDIRLRLSMYRVVITTGRRIDAETFLHPDHLVNDWPIQRRLLGHRYCEAWERHLPELAARLAEAVRAGEMGWSSPPSTTVS